MPDAGPARASTLDLSPAAAARSVQLAVQTAPPLTPPARQELLDSEVDRAAEARAAQGIPGLRRSGSSDELITRSALALNAVIAKPWDYIREPMRGARYVYFGTRLDAVIARDGSVRFRSREGLQLLGSTTVEDELFPPTPTGGLGFRDGWRSKAMGRDVHASERRAFLERTRALRELLYQRALRLALSRADAHLTERLAVIAHKLEVGNDQRGRAELFALWDECAEDEVGSRARGRIEDFTREHCGRDSDARFPDGELLALNRGRISKQPFDPYHFDAGGSLTETDASVP